MRICPHCCTFTREIDEMTTLEMWNFQLRAQCFQQVRALQWKLRQEVDAVNALTLQKLCCLYERRYIGLGDFQYWLDLLFRANKVNMVEAQKLRQSQIEFSPCYLANGLLFNQEEQVAA